MFSVEGFFLVFFAGLRDFLKELRGFLNLGSREKWQQGVQRLLSHAKGLRRPPLPVLVRVAQQADPPEG